VRVCGYVLAGDRKGFAGASRSSSPDYQIERGSGPDRTMHSRSNGGSISTGAAGPLSDGAASPVSRSGGIQALGMLLTRSCG
jgi:hypothetical protein